MMSTPSTPTVRLTRHFNGSPERVFDAWLDPTMIGQWMFGPFQRDEEVVRITLDPRIGGTFSFLVRRQGIEIDHVGEYLVINRPRQLIFTWGIAGSDNSRVTLDITSAATGADLMLTHELHPDWADYVPQTEAGWVKILTAVAGFIDAMHATNKSDENPG